MQPELSRVIEQVSKEKGIDRAIVVNAVEAVMLSAARKIVAPTTRLEAKFNVDIGEVELFKILTVMETVTDPETEVSLEDAHNNLDPEAEVGVRFDDPDVGIRWPDLEFTLSDKDRKHPLLREIPEAKLPKFGA